MLSYLFRIVSIRLANEVQAVRGQDLALVPLLAQPHVFVILSLRYSRHRCHPLLSLSLPRPALRFQYPIA